MSLLWWRHALVPSTEPPRDTVYEIYDQPFRLARTLRFAEPDEEIVTLPDPRAQRAMSRTALLLAAAALPSRTALGPLLDGDPFQVGLYCAVENGAPDYECAKVIARTPRDEFASVYRRNLRFAAKQYLRQLPNLAAAHVAIFLKIMGPLTVFTHSEHGSLHALQQAEHDLETGSVRAALVCSAFSLEDPLSSARTRRRLPAEVTLSEAAAALVLVPGGGARHWRSEPGDGQRSYGIAHPLVALARPGGAIAAAGVEGAPR